jgi:hypothetical protein
MTPWYRQGDRLKRLYGKNVSPQATVFMDAIQQVCVEHGYSIGHEDGHGSFIVRKDTDPEGIHGAFEEVVETERTAVHTQATEATTTALHAIEDNLGVQFGHDAVHVHHDDQGRPVQFVITLGLEDARKLVVDRGARCAP